MIVICAEMVNKPPKRISTGPRNGRTRQLLSASAPSITITVSLFKETARRGACGTEFRDVSLLGPPSSPDLRAISLSRKPGKKEENVKKKGTFLSGGEERLKAYSRPSPFPSHHVSLSLSVSPSHSVLRGCWHTTRYESSEVSCRL